MTGRSKFKFVVSCPHGMWNSSWFRDGVKRLHKSQIQTAGRRLLAWTLDATNALESVTCSRVHQGHTTPQSWSFIQSSVLCIQQTGVFLKLQNMPHVIVSIECTRCWLLLPMIAVSVSHAAELCGGCIVCGVIQCNLCQITLASCYNFIVQNLFFSIFNRSVVITVVRLTIARFCIKYQVHVIMAYDKTKCCLVYKCHQRLSWTWEFTRCIRQTRECAAIDSGKPSWLHSVNMLEIQVSRWHRSHLCDTDGFCVTCLIAISDCVIGVDSCCQTVTTFIDDFLLTCLNFDGVVSFFQVQLFFQM